MDYVNMPEVDIAYEILTARGKDNVLYYKDLVMDVIEKKQKPVQSLAVAISEVYTMINMDGRFHYEGDGNWGLTEWNPPVEKKSHSKTSKASTSKKELSQKKKFETIQTD
ncbi:MAG: DNA-directed RNA polymerase subunit delta [Selenomonadaceae bacterium]|nr:DNA-directed RNA polymerase subunit delta [Selenomonadaceae bacterium]